jgi:hypothetical protein
MIGVLSILGVLSVQSSAVFDRIVALVLINSGRISDAIRATGIPE